MDDDEIEAMVRRASFCREVERLASGDVDTVLDACKDLAATESVEH